MKADYHASIGEISARHWLISGYWRMLGTSYVKAVNGYGQRRVTGVLSLWLHGPVISACSRLWWPTSRRLHWRSGRRYVLADNIAPLHQCMPHRPQWLRHGVTTYRAPALFANIKAGDVAARPLMIES